MKMLNMITRRILLAMILLLTAACDRQDDAAVQKSIVVIYENDVHCAIDGYPQFAGYRDAVAAADTAYVLTVSSGDYLQGGMPGLFSGGGWLVDIMNSVGYDAVTVGNHEFDYKAERFKQLMERLSFPALCANLTDPQGTRLLKPYVLKKCGKRTVAFVGALTPDAETYESYAFFDSDGHRLLDLNAGRFISMVQDAVDQARAEGADYVILLSHVGEKDAAVTSRDLIAATTGIDVLLDGHTHSVIPEASCLAKDGRRVVTSQTGTGFSHVGQLVIRPDGRISTRLIALEEIADRSEQVQRTVDDVKSQYAATGSLKIGTALQTLSISENGERIVRRQECTVGNLVADAYRAVAGAQVGIVNGGGVRADLKAGDITNGDIVSIQPFGNNLAKVECAGSGIIAMLEKCAESWPQENGAFAQVSGIRYVIDGTNRNKVTVDVLDDLTGAYVPMDPAQRYTLAITDYMIETFAAELGGFTCIDASLMPDFEACVRYISDNLNGVVGAAYAAVEGRIMMVVE